MYKSLSLLAGLLPVIAGTIFLGACSCGFDCNNEDSQGTTVLSLGLSDALPEDLKQVVLEIDSITFRRVGAADVVVDSFTIPALNLVSADTFQVDLLQYRGRNRLVVITDLELPSGNYSQVLLKVLGGDVNRSYVQRSDDTLGELNVSGGVLTLPGANFARSNQDYTVEFSLAQSLRAQSADTLYLLSAQGVRLENNATAASLSGRVDSSLFNSVAPCSDKTEPGRGNRIYLYQGSRQSGKRLGDVFASNSGTTVPGDVLAPFAVASLVQNSLTANWEYVFGFLPAGAYTMAFSCNTAADDSVDYDGLVVPLPTSQVYSVTLAAGAAVVCDLTAKGSC
ncbi:MAG: DUF4382 domain-containing protein [Gammaproteobacteria bacterium]|nr:DUF4382 domain-containing protein [Gammaproteobacteria bacterium]